MSSRQGEKVIDFKDGEFETDLQEDQAWGNLLEELKQKTRDERRDMNVGDTIRFEQEDISIRKVGQNDYELVIEGSRIQKGIQKVQRFVGNLTRR